MKKSVLLSLGFVVLAANADVSSYSYIGRSGGSSDDPLIAANWQEGVVPPSGANLVFDTIPQDYGVRFFYNVREGETDVIKFGSISGRGTWNLQFGGTQNKKDVLGSIATAKDFNGCIFTGGGYPLTVDPVDNEVGRINHFVPNPRCSSSGAAFNEQGIRVPEGKNVEIGKVYDTYYWRKWGDGKLTVEDANGEFGRIQLEEGALQLKSVPSVENITSLPGVPFMHFDASKSETIELDASNRVSKWNDVSGNGVYAHQLSTTVACPTVKSNFANGLSVLDFGAFSMNGTYLGEALKDDKSNESASLQPSVIGQKCYEIFVVAADKVQYCSTAAEWNAPFIIGNASFDFHRGGHGQLIGNGQSKPSSRYGKFTINGKRVEPTLYNAHTTRLRVISMSFDNPFEVSYFANDRGGIRRGGIYLAEYISYSNALTEVERKQVVNYLKNKWLSADEIAADDVDLSELYVKGGTVSVDGEETVKVKSLNVAKDASLVKTGEGTLEVKTVYPTSNLSVDVRGGVVNFVKGQHDSNERPQIASDAILHFDASAEATFTLVENNGKSFVSEWKDVRLESERKCYAHSQDKMQMPWLVRNAVNGKSVVDFGPYTTSVDAEGSGWLWLPDDMSQYWLKEGFYVYKDNAPNSKAFVFGDWNKNKDGLYPFHRYSNGILLSPYHSSPFLHSGRWTVNGVAVNPTEFAPSADEFNVVSFASADILKSISTLGRDRISSIGGIQLAEVILYSRELTEKERRDTQAYLLKKWKNQSHPDCVENIAFSNVKLSGEGSAVGINGMAAQIESVETDGAVRVIGDGEVTVNSIIGENGMSADGSTLTYVEKIPSPTFHVDASVEGSLEVETINGTNFVSRWNDIRGEGYPFAYHRIDASANVTDGVKPYIVENVTNSLPAVDFGPFFSYSQDQQKLSFEERNTIALQKGGAGLEWSKSVNVKEYFIVWGDHNDEKKSAFALGHSSSMPTHRGDRGVIFGGHADDNLEKYSRINLNGEESMATARLPEGLNVVAVSITNGGSVAVNTFVRDRSNCRLGGTVLGEVLVYDYTLTPHQRDLIVSYLCDKWHAKKVAAAKQYESLSVANDGVVSLAKSDIVSKSVSGDGTVVTRMLNVSETISSTGTLNINVVEGANVTIEDDVTIGVVIDSQGTPSTINVNGDVNITGSGIVEVSLAKDGKVVYGDYPILTVNGNINIPDGISSWGISSDLTSKHTLSLQLNGNKLYLRVLSPGTCIILK